MTGTTSCTQCPGGSECITASSAPVACGDGFVAAAGSTACTACTPGELKVNQASSLSINFVKYHFVYCLVLSQLVCGSSYFVCVFSSHLLCIVSSHCPAYCVVTGETPNALQTACEPCPQGFQCNDPTIDPVQCADGYYTTGGATSCERCDPGFWCSTSAQTACTSGACACALIANSFFPERSASKALFVNCSE